METLRKPDDDNDHDDTRPNIKAQPRRVAVKFIDNFQLPYEEGAEKYFSAEWKGLWEKLLAKFSGLTLKPVFTAVSPDRIEELISRAMQLDPTYRPPNFLTFYAIDVSSLRRAKNLVKTLTSWKIVEEVYVESLPSLPTTQPQRYVESPSGTSAAATSSNDIGGIGVSYAWDLSGGDGSGVNFVDIEKGWCLVHPDLHDPNGQRKFSAPLGGSFNYGIRPDKRDYLEIQHGTSVLGILATKMNVADPKGWKGIAYGAKGNVISPWKGNAPNPSSDPITGKLTSSEAQPPATSYQQPGEWNIANAVLVAIDCLNFGDVILLEVQAENPVGTAWPVEIEAAIFQMIRLATALGIIVVEAAGNGIEKKGIGNNIDLIKKDSGAILDLIKEASGAIIVGAARPTSRAGTAGSRRPPSNFGARVDCFAWGDTVYSLNVDLMTAEPGTDISTRYTSNFTGTSAAAAIIAGAAIVLQGIRQKAFSSAESSVRLSAFQMRNILRDRGFITNEITINTHSADEDNDQIGVMPNLQYIIENTLRIVPDVLIHDFKDDTGDPHSRELSDLDSPDVSVSTSDELDREVSVQVFNRGGAAATGVQATVYWTNSLTNPLRPDQWTKIGTSSAATVPVGTSQGTALPKIFWPAGQSIGSYWLIVTVGCPSDPDPVPDHTALPKELNEFLALIQSNNNITLKNQLGPILG